ncbi:integrase catalytic domain-containing protein [Nephila pilipes]|uniref:Integrase catalytic domain-containing protein n=1 Tax=Nephila pilipes TaxID=299642 RepID=A0A8X6QZQ5_NEPPI|nr:integrase catalytic domain-containing protein [Nephila pilipes]
MLHARLIDNDTKNWAIRCYFVQFQKNSSFHRTIKQSLNQALFGTEPKTGLQSSPVSKMLLEKLVTEDGLDLLLNQHDHDIILIPKYLPAAFLENNTTLQLQKIYQHLNELITMLQLQMIYQ